jgi:hypothetical protein
MSIRAAFMLFQRVLKAKESEREMEKIHFIIVKQPEFKAGRISVLIAAGAFSARAD